MDDFERWLDQNNLADEFMDAEWPDVQRIIEWYCQACQGETQTLRLEI